MQPDNCSFVTRCKHSGVYAGPGEGCDVYRKSAPVWASGSDHSGIWCILCLERLESRGRGSEKCGTKTIGTSSSQSQTARGSDTGLRARSTPAAFSVCFQQLGLACLNSMTPA